MRSLDCAFRLHEIKNKVLTPFEINDNFDTLFADIVPDYHYYTNVHHDGKLNCDYYFEDKFRCKVEKMDESQLSFHLNVKSISKHYDALELHLNSLDFKFSFIGLSETWLEMTTRNNFIILGAIPVSIHIEKIKRVVVSHFISKKVLLSSWEMTLTILKGKRTLFLPKSINVSLTQIPTLSCE